MKKLILLFSLILMLSNNCYGASSIKLTPQMLTEKDTSKYEEVNKSVEIIYNKIKPKIKTDKYPKFYHDFTTVKPDDTQNPNYYYVKNGSAELIFSKSDNELKFISYRRSELPNCRIIYEYPSGKFLAVQVYESKSEVFIFDSEGKYVNYEPYVKSVREKVQKNWKSPDKRHVAALLKDKKSVPVQVALTLNKDGHVKRCRITESSKIKEFDDNVGQAIKASAPFNPFPQNFFNEELVIILNFNFSVK